MDPNTEATKPTTETPAEPVDAAAEFAAAMDEGIAVATPAPVEEIVDTPAAPVPGSPEALAAEQKAAEEGKPADVADPKAAKPEPDADTEKEIADLGIKNEKTAQRFREMAGEIKALAPLKAELEKAGIKDIADLPQIVRAAKDGTDLIGMVQSTGADAEQFGKTLDYLSLVNKGDPASLEKAWTSLTGELADLAKILGKEVPGVHDPLSEHPDLREDIEKGDITRARALEIAQGRTHQKIEGVRKQHVEAQTSQQRAIEQAQTEGVNALRAWEQQMLAADPTYMSKRDELNAKVADIRKQFPPAQWVAATQLAYAAIAAKVAPVQQPAKAPVGPMRPGLSRPALAPAVFDNPEDAMEAGIAAASG